MQNSREAPPQCSPIKEAAEMGTLFTALHILPIGKLVSFPYFKKFLLTIMDTQLFISKGESAPILNVKKKK